MIILYDVTLLSIITSLVCCILSRSLLFRHAGKVNYLQTNSQLIDSQYNTAQQNDTKAQTVNSTTQPHRFSEAHKYDIPASNQIKTKNDYDHIDFQYEQADHPFQQSFTNGGLTENDTIQQEKYNVLVHSSSMDKLGKLLPGIVYISSDH